MDYGLAVLQMLFDVSHDADLLRIIAALYQ